MVESDQKDGMFETTLSVIAEHPVEVTLACVV